MSLVGRKRKDGSEQIKFEFGGREHVFLGRTHRKLIKWGILPIPDGYRVHYIDGKRFSIRRINRDERFGQIQRPEKGDEYWEKAWLYCQAINKEGQEVSSGS